MSLPREVITTCEHCGNKYEIMIWDTINSFMSPEMKASVQNMRLFFKPCPHCKKPNMVFFPTLYHQMEDKFMVQFIPDRNMIDYMLNIPDEINPIRISQKKDNYIMRIVDDPVRLAEKTTILDKKLDDRAIEFMKCILIHKTIEEKGPDVFNHKDPDIFLKYDNNEPKFVIVINDTPKFEVNFNENLYNDIKERMNKHINDMNKDDSVIIDLRWAAKNIDIVFADK